MVPGDSPVMLLINAPSPAPSSVLSPLMVGLFVVPQHTPRLVTASQPSSSISPPPDAVVCVIYVIVEVLTTGGVGSSFTVYGTIWRFSYIYQPLNPWPQKLGVPRATQPLVPMTYVTN